MKTILITGASSGIGKELTIQYLSLNYKVIACGRDKSKLNKLYDHQTKNKGNLTTLSFNINDLKNIINSTSNIKSIDIAILNAGDCEYIDDAKNFDGHLFSRVINTNLIGTGNCLHAILPKMKTNSNLAIISSAVTILPLTRAEAYGASKAGLDYLAKSLSIDLYHSQIHVSLIRPGFVDTPLTQKNTFKMPGIISAEKAAKLIINGIQKNKRIINFPSFFFISMYLLSALPHKLWQILAGKK